MLRRVSLQRPERPCVSALRTRVSAGASSVFLGEFLGLVAVEESAQTAVAHLVGPGALVAFVKVNWLL